MLEVIKMPLKSFVPLFPIIESRLAMNSSMGKYFKLSILWV